MPSFTNFGSRRSVRKTGDTLDENIEQIRKIARLVNGIYAIRGLTDGSIQPDAFISELLRLGPLTLPKIQEMNLADSKITMRTMKDILENLAVTELEAKAEQRYRDFDAFRKDTKDIGDIGNLAGLDDYKKELETLKALVIDGVKISALRSTVYNFMIQANELFKPFNADKVLSNVDHMRPTVIALETASADFGKFASFKKIQESNKIIDPISKVAEGITECASKKTSLHRDSVDVSADKIYYDKIGSYKNLTSTAIVDEKNIKAVLSIFESRIQTPVTFAYTSGFINGPSDLNEIPKDLNDAKLKILVSDPDSLLKAMEPLNSIGEAAGAVEKSFGSLIEHKKALELILSERKPIVEFSEKADSLVTAMKGVHECNFSSLGLVASLEEVKKLLKEAGELKKKMDPFSKIIAMSNFLIDYPSHLKYINAELNSVDKSKKEAVEAIHKRLVKSGSFKNVYETLNSSISSFEQVPQISQDPKMSDMATTILQSFPKIAEFQKDAAGHVAFFKCLQGVKNVESIPDGIQKIQRFRQIDLKPVEEGIRAVEDVEKAVKEFGRLEDAVNALSQMKNTLNPETKALEKLQNPSEHSMTIGGAARGIIEMKSAFGQKSVVKSHLNLVAEELKTTKLLPAADVENLKKLESISKFFEDLESWTKEVNVTEPSKLKDYSVIFLEAQKVTGIEDLEKIRDSVKILENSVQDAAKKKDLNELKAALDALNDLKFSSYRKQFADAAGTLEKLDLFFAQYSYELHPTTEYIEPSTSTLETTSFSPTTDFNTAQLQQKTTSTMLTTTVPVLFPVAGYAIIVGIVACAVAGGSVIYCWLQRLCCFKKN